MNNSGTCCEVAARFFYLGEYMGAPDRLDFHFTKFLGFGIAVDTFPYTISISIVLPFFTVEIGLGKPYTEQ